ncbi:MAG: hypothetical protein AAGI71_11805 [Bacteroidota bacterium]
MTTLRDRLARLPQALGTWLTAPAPHAAQRMGLFRIVFALFYLWHLSRYHAVAVAYWPGEPLPVLGIAWVPDGLPAAVYLGLEAVVIGLLVLLMIGHRTQLVTVLLLVVGGFYEAFFIAQHYGGSTVFLTVYIPLFMALAGSWGRAYSLDAYLHGGHREEALARPAEEGFHLMPVRATLIVASALFLSAGLLKVMAGGTWLTYTRIMPDTVLHAITENAAAGLPVAPIGRWLSEATWLHDPLRYGVVAFESLFWLALFGGRLRLLIFGAALLFHSLNGIWVNVTFTPFLVFYLMFVDWEAWKQRLGRVLPSVPRWPTLPSAVLVGGSLVLALTAAASWNLHPGLRDVVSVGGLLTEETLMYPVLPIALFMIGRALVGAPKTRSTTTRPSKEAPKAGTAPA